MIFVIRSNISNYSVAVKQFLILIIRLFFQNPILVKVSKLLKNKRQITVFKHSSDETFVTFTCLEVFTATEIYNGFSAGQQRQGISKTQRL
jgi:hypothetical protein